MKNLKYLFAQPDYIEGIGNIYPIQLKDYDKFQECSNILYISKNHFAEIDTPLLALIFLSVEHLGYKPDDLILIFEKLFSLVLRKTVLLHSNNENIWFQTKNKLETETEDNIIINFFNYDELRSTIMKQNLIFEQKIYKNKLVQEWANKVLESRSKNSAKISIEDIITTVSVYKSKNYDELMEYSIYQIYADFYRIRKMKKYDTDTLFATVAEKITIEDFAEEINMFKSPYDDLFVSSDKLNKFSAIT